MFFWDNNWFGYNESNPFHQDPFDYGFPWSQMNFNNYNSDCDYGFEDFFRTFVLFKFFFGRRH